MQINHSIAEVYRTQKNCETRIHNSNRIRETSTIMEDISKTLDIKFKQLAVLNRFL